MSTFPPYFVVSPTKEHLWTIVVLPGRGYDGRTFANHILQLESWDESNICQQLPFVKWVFPSAPIRYSTSLGFELREWFDLPVPTIPEQESNIQRRELVKSMLVVEAIIEEQTKELSGNAGNVILGGFHMGMAVAVHVMLRLAGRKVNIGGLFGCCGWLPCHQELRSALHEYNVGGPVQLKFEAVLRFYDKTLKMPPGSTWMHFDSMPLVSLPVCIGHHSGGGGAKIESGLNVKEFLKKLGIQVQWKQHKEGAPKQTQNDAIDYFFDFLKGLVVTQGSLQ